MIKTHVVIHHSATPDGQTFDTSAIRRFHTSWRIGGRIVTVEEARQAQERNEYVEPPWRDIGYHLLIEKVGSQYEAIVGRSWDEDGAHCPQGGMNRVGLGVCIVGNWDDLPPSWEQLRVTTKTLRWAMAILRIPFDRAYIKPHSFYNPDKSCPGKHFPLDELYKMLEV